MNFIIQVNFNEIRNIIIQRDTVNELFLDFQQWNLLNSSSTIETNVFKCITSGDDFFDNSEIFT